GPATINGDVLTLTGDIGFVTVKASQQGDTTWSPAPDVTQTFEVIDPLTIFPEIDVKNPVEGGVVRAPNLNAIAISASTDIAYPHMLMVNKVEFDIGGNVIEADLQHNGYFMGYWTPPGFGSYTLTATAFSSEGPTTSQSFSFEVVADAPAIDITLVDMLSFQSTNTLDTSIILPSFSGTYTQVMAYLEYDCPCDPWDRIANIEVRGANGEFIELLRYITPYGVACNDAIDITDFVSQLQGKVDFHFSFTQSYVTLRFEYTPGTPAYPYSWIYKLWDGTYAFGDMENLQPLEIYDLGTPEGTQDAYLRILSSGHGWGENNTGNAAEFYNATHYINVNGGLAYEQNLWQDCNPNPAGCQPQNGTWYYDRAGWCPGSIPILYRYHLQPYLGGSQMEIQYQWDPDYVDYCHPSNPDCVSGVTCPDCNAGFDPQIVVAGEFVVFSNDVIIGVEEPPAATFNVQLAPNPTTGIFKLSLEGTAAENTFYSVHDITGNIVTAGEWHGRDIRLDLSGLPDGLYLVKVNTSGGARVEKLVLRGK
ncbi:MAG TPA: peptide-N-glycosidase F-related protein, partial [Bacteroidales bacterium]|nr:peptide-N-glycosidase F-related protein [Bacteroidales bacterium]